MKVKYIKRPRFFPCRLIWVLSVPLPPAETATIAFILSSRLIFLYSFIAGIHISPILARGGGGGVGRKWIKIIRKQESLVFFPLVVPYGELSSALLSKDQRRWTVKFSVSRFFGSPSDGSQYLEHHVSDVLYTKHCVEPHPSSPPFLSYENRSETAKKIFPDV